MDSVSFNTEISDHGRTTRNINSYTNYGQHASDGGKINNYGGERRVFSEQAIPQPSVMPLIESQSSSPHRPARHAAQDAVSNHNNTTNTDLWKEALERYKEKTGFDIRDKSNKLSQQFDTCEGSGDAFAVLMNLPVFRKANARPTWIKIKDSLKKVLNVVIFLNGLAGEVGNFVRRRLRSTSKLPAQCKFIGRHFRVSGKRSLLGLASF